MATLCPGGGKTLSKADGTNYALGGSTSAWDLFNRRTLQQHGALFVPDLHPGMRLVDFGVVAAKETSSNTSINGCGRKDPMCAA